MAVNHVGDTDAKRVVLIAQEPVLHNSAGFGCSVVSVGFVVISGSFLPFSSAQGMCLDQPNRVETHQNVT